MEDIIVQESFNAPIQKVWDAITNLDEMKQWYFENIDSFRPVVGAKSSFEVKSGERTFTHMWEVTQSIPPYTIQYRWRYAEYPGDSFVTFNIREESGKTMLVLRASVVEDFPAEIPEFKRESCLAGWEYFIKERLKRYIG